PPGPRMPSCLPSRRARDPRLPGHLDGRVPGCRVAQPPLPRSAAQRRAELPTGAGDRGRDHAHRGLEAPSMFRRYNVVDERDLTEAADPLSAFLPDATRAAPTILPLATARRSRHAEPQPREHGQNTDNSAGSAVAPASQAAVSS